MTAGVLALADELRAVGLEVMVPDLFEGEVFSEVDSGVDYSLRVGFGEIISRGVASIASLQQSVVVVGLSLGALPAQYLAQTDRRVHGAVLVGACIPLGEFSDEWPEGVPLEVHAASGDPVFDGDGDAEAVAAIVAAAAAAQVVRHHGGGHLCCERGHRDYDELTSVAVINAVASMTATS